MYKGNMYEFLEKIIDYVERKHGIKFNIERSNDYEQEPPKRTPDGKPSIRNWKQVDRKRLVLWHYPNGNRNGFGVGQALYDTENFEEEVIKFINERLSKQDVQW